MRAAPGPRGAWLYVAPSFTEAGVVHSDELGALAERDRVSLRRPELGLLGPFRESLKRARVQGVVFEMARGWPGRHQLAAAARLLPKYRVVFFWPQEHAAEAVDVLRLASYWALWARAKAHARRHPPPSGVGGDLGLATAPQDRAVAEVRSRAQALLAGARPVPFPELSDGRVQGWGLYLRTDYWAPIKTGGSYGHTCYVAKELASRCEQFACLMANRFPLLDKLGARQVVLQAHAAEANETALLSATPTWALQLRPLFEAVEPAFVYERLCLGNLAGAQLCHELGIPYLVEYNGSELSIKKSFDATGYSGAELFEEVEEAAFAQATVVSVVSEPIRASLVERGVAPEKILVNPNGADPVAYRPASGEEKAALRRELGFAPSDCVIGFTGSFGGWHGIEVLAEALPQVLGRSPRAAFLLIGDGKLRPLVQEAVDNCGGKDRVVMTGLVDHEEGARLLRACDVFVSPHASHMVDSPFFGSPTKLFEYMATGGAIVASDLEQIGEVLRPALKPSEVAQDDLVVGDRRAVLCEPGDAAQLSEALCSLVGRPEVAAQLGRNARQALVEGYTWAKHVERLLAFASSTGARPAAPRQRARAVAGRPAEAATRGQPETVTRGHADRSDGDARADGAGRAHSGPGHGTAEGQAATVTAYKAEVKRQWDADPCGSHYVAQAEEGTLEWFAEAERYRYVDYAPWMPKVMEFTDWAGKQVLEVGGGIGTDLVQFARNGASTTDCDLSTGHLQLARQNFALRGLQGNFVSGDGEDLPFAAGSFDLVYSNGALHHTPRTQRAVEELHRVLRPGGRAIVMVYAEVSWHYWAKLVGDIGLRQWQLEELSMGEIMSRNVELSTTGARPLVKVYTAASLRRLFAGFERVRVHKYQFTPAERPKPLRAVPASWLGRVMGWNLVVKADKALR